MVTFIDEWRRKFPSCMVVKRLIHCATVSSRALGTYAHRVAFDAPFCNPLMGLTVARDSRDPRAGAAGIIMDRAATGSAQLWRTRPKVSSDAVEVSAAHSRMWCDVGAASCDAAPTSYPSLESSADWIKADGCSLFDSERNREWWSEWVDIFCVIFCAMGHYRDKKKPEFGTVPQSHRMTSKCLYKAQYRTAVQPYRL